VAAEQEAAAEKDQRRRVMEAAANGSLPLLSAPGEKGAFVAVWLR
jgi:hypothetical protein